MLSQQLHQLQPGTGEHKALTAFTQSETNNLADLAGLLVLLRLSLIESVLKQELKSSSHHRTVFLAIQTTLAATVDTSTRHGLSTQLQTKEQSQMLAKHIIQAVETQAAAVNSVMTVQHLTDMFAAKSLTRDQTSSLEQSPMFRMKSKLTAQSKLDSQFTKTS